MVLQDAFNAVLTIAKELTGDQGIKQALSDDIALVESKANEGITALEAHVADWFAKHYALPAPQAVTSTAGPASPEPPAAPSEPVAAAAFTPADDTQAAQPGTAF